MFQGLPSAKFKTIVIDPPWPTTFYGNGSAPYRTMPITQIALLPIRQLADKDCNVFLWTPNNFMEDAFGLLRLWCIKYKITITWCKMDGLGRPPYSATEHCLMASYGQPPRPHQKGEAKILNHFTTRRALRHSEKPDYFYSIVESISQSPGLDMFSRKKREGWTCWGDEVETNNETTQFVN